MAGWEVGQPGVDGAFSPFLRKDALLSCCSLCGVLLAAFPHTLVSPFGSIMCPLRLPFTPNDPGPSAAYMMSFLLTQLPESVIETLLFGNIIYC